MNLLVYDYIVLENSFIFFKIAPAGENSLRAMLACSRTFCTLVKAIQGDYESYLITACIKPTAK